MNTRLIFKEAAEKGASLRDANPYAQQLKNHFLSAARTGDAQKLKDAVTSFPKDVDLMLHHGTALQAACERNHPQAVNVLLEAGASPNVLNRDRLTSPMHEAAKNDNTMILVQLIHKRGDVNLDSLNGTPAERAIDANANKALGVLVTHGAASMKFDDEGHTLLHRAARLDRAESLCLLLSKGLDINALARDGKTPLMVAAEFGSLNVAKVLLERGADYRIMDDMRDTALDIITQHGGNDERTVEGFRSLLKARITQDAEQAAKPFNDGAEKHIAIRRPLKLRKT